MADGLEKPAGAAPDVPAVKPPEGAAPQPGKEQVVPPGFAPISALQGEQANTAKAREEALRYRTHLELHGFTFDEQGNPSAPAAAAPPPTIPQPAAIDPETAELAASIGIDAEKLQRVIDKRVVQTGGVLLDPITRQGFEQSKRGYATDDPDFSIYAKSFEEEVNKRVGNLPREYQAVARTHPELLNDARAAAKAKHWPELLDKAVERKVQEKTGKVRGTFTEGAAPGAGEAPNPEPFNEASLEWMRKNGYTEQQIQAAAASREVSRRGR